MIEKKKDAKNIKLTIDLCGFTQDMANDMNLKQIHIFTVLGTLRSLIECGAIPDIKSRIGHPAMLEQTAEEATEFAHACLKMARYIRGENDTHKEWREVYDNYTEEFADMLMCMCQLITPKDAVEIADKFDQKVERCKKRIEESDAEK